VGSLITSNCAYKRDVLEKMGMFDENFLTSGEDIDLCWRLAKENRNLYFDPTLKVYHIFQDSLKSMWRQYFKYGIGSTKLRKKYFNKSYVDLYIYKLLLTSVTKIMFLKRRDSTFHFLRCFQILAHVSGRVYESARSHILNV